MSLDQAQSILDAYSRAIAGLQVREAANEAANRCFDQGAPNLASVVQSGLTSAEYANEGLDRLVELCPTLTREEWHQLMVFELNMRAVPNNKEEAMKAVRSVAQLIGSGDEALYLVGMVTMHKLVAH